MKRISVIKLDRQRMSFSAGHFTIFSATKREKMHGHNYRVCIALTTLIDETGLAFDYRDYKQKLYRWCDELDEFFLIPTQSPHLTLKETDLHYEIKFSHETLFFPKTDVKLLPISNVTVEELSHYFLQRLLQDKHCLTEDSVQAIEVKVATAPGQSGSTQWKRDA